MTTTTGDAGGYAFPHDEKDGGGQHWQTHDGMTLRDYFAAQVVVGLGTWSPMPYPLGGLDQARALKARAILAYDQADAMLEARKR